MNRVSEEPQYQKVWHLTSPDASLAVDIKWEYGKIFFCVMLGVQRVVDWSSLGICTSLADFSEELSPLAEAHGIVDERYRWYAGKVGSSVNHYEELRLTFHRHDYPVAVEFRAYADAVAYRYVIPTASGFRVYRETSGLILAENLPWQAWAQAVVNNYEGFYLQQTGIPRAETNCPLLIHCPEPELWALVSEAVVSGDYVGSHLVAGDQPTELVWRWAKDQNNPVEVGPNFSSPWRVLLLGRDLKTLFASTTIEDLNPPQALMDPSWVRPGRVYWSWWAGLAQDDYAVHARYVQFAAQMGWEYYLCDAGWQEAWLSDLIQLGKDLGVGIWVWVHHREMVTAEARAERLARWAKMGVVGVKVDFFDSDSQEKMRVYQALAEDCARYRLLVNFHGATKPSGERRQWPHLLSREGVYGAEYYKSHEGPTAEHNCTLPFTRNIVGPMDYTPVSFSNCRGKTTLGGQLALLVIFESGVQHISDDVESLTSYGPEVLAYLRACPVAWDFSELLDGYPGRRISLIRRSGSTWFWAAISAESTARLLHQRLSFLNEGMSYRAHCYQDQPDGTGLSSSIAVVDAGQTLDLTVAPHGGSFVWFEPIDVL